MEYTTGRGLGIACNILRMLVQINFNSLHGIGEECFVTHLVEIRPVIWREHLKVKVYAFCGRNYDDNDEQNNPLCKHVLQKEHNTSNMHTLNLPIKDFFLKHCSKTKFLTLL
jgi:hypothetical protein